MEENRQEIERRISEREAKKPDWYDSASFKFENGLGEDWAARIRHDGLNTFVDVTGVDVEYEVRTARLTKTILKLHTGSFGWILDDQEILFVSAVIMAAEERHRVIVNRSLPPL